MAETEKKIEIERRFLLAAQPKERADRTFFIDQYYDPIVSDRSVIRYRHLTQLYPNGGHMYEKIIKNPLSKGINEEQHMIISSIEDFNESIKTLKQHVGKWRHVYERGDLKFEVDCFQFMQLVICEVELPSLDTEFELPSFIKELVIKEITGEQEFSNYNLSKLGVTSF